MAKREGLKPTENKGHTSRTPIEIEEVTFHSTRFVSTFPALWPSILPPAVLHDLLHLVGWGGYNPLYPIHLPPLTFSLTRGGYVPLDSGWSSTSLRLHGLERLLSTPSSPHLHFLDFFRLTGEVTVRSIQSPFSLSQVLTAFSILVGRLRSTQPTFALYRHSKAHRRGYHPLHSVASVRFPAFPIHQTLC